jgi:hypothetical protein
MKLIFCLLLSMLSCSCNSRDNEYDCYNIESSKVSLMHDSVYINLPYDILVKKDTFYLDYDVRKIYYANYNSADSQSSFNVTIHDYQDWPRIVGKDLANIFDGMQSIDEFLYHFTDSDYVMQEIDTINDFNKAKYIALIEHKTRKKAIGGLCFFLNKQRIKMHFEVSDSNFKAAENKLKCILNSLQVKLAG